MKECKDSNNFMTLEPSPNWFLWIAKDSRSIMTVGRIFMVWNLMLLMRNGKD